jgi:hypothetical protein
MYCSSAACSITTRTMVPSAPSSNHLKSLSVVNDKGHLCDSTASYLQSLKPVSCISSRPTHGAATGYTHHGGTSMQQKTCQTTTWSDNFSHCNQLDYTFNSYVHHRPRMQRVTTCSHANRPNLRYTMSRLILLLLLLCQVATSRLVSHALQRGLIIPSHDQKTSDALAK